MNDKDLEQLLNCPSFRERLKSRDREVVRTLAALCLGPLLDYIKKTQHTHRLLECLWEDAIQKLLAKLLVNPPDLDPMRPVMPYLRQMALNEARDMRKSENRIKLRTIKAGKLRHREHGDDLLPIEIIIRKEARENLQQKMNSLSDQDQQAIMIPLVASKGRTIKALAEYESISTPAAQMRNKRALERLADQCQHNEDRA